MQTYEFRSGKMFGSVSNDNIMDYRYERWLVGVGISYAYRWILGKRWGAGSDVTPI